MPTPLPSCAEVRPRPQASTLVDDKWVKFPEWQGQPGGVTGAVLLAESHLAIHTWPETGNVTIDVYVCNFSDDNSAKAQALMDGVVAAYAPKTPCASSCGAAISLPTRSASTPG